MEPAPTNRSAERQVNFLLGCHILSRQTRPQFYVCLWKQDTRLVFRSPFLLAVVEWPPPYGGIYTRVLKTKLRVRMSRWSHTASMILHSALTAVDCTSKRTNFCHYEKRILEVCCDMITEGCSHYMVSYIFAHHGH